MNIEHRIEGNVVVAEVKATRIDAAAAIDFRAAIQAAIGNARKVVLDIAQVTFVDSTGLGAIVSILKMPGGPRTVAIAGACGQVEVLFRLTRMNKVFIMYRSCAEAMAA